MYNGSTILLCVTIFIIHKQCLIRAHCSIVTVVKTLLLYIFPSLCFTVLHCASLCFTVLHCASLCFTVLHCASLCFTVLHCASLCFTVLYCALLCFTVLHCAIVTVGKTLLLYLFPLFILSWNVDTDL
jgi:hypothetical protein